ncbi:hypothetical protein [Stenotrophomonas sp. PD6]|uniref:hypothetical protein n=1 Tax=Stenotrophomonas sp. PD6 TaxID=3368612 RepID=UPI003B9ECB7D
MNKRGVMRVKVDEALRMRFRGAASRARTSPAHLIRLLMQEYVEIQGGHPAYCPPVDEHTFESVANAVVRAVPPAMPIFVYEDDDEQTVARKEGWWCEALAENPRY